MIIAAISTLALTEQQLKCTAIKNLLGRRQKEAQSNRGHLGLSGIYLDF